MNDLILVIDQDLGILTGFEKILGSEQFTICTSIPCQEVLSLIANLNPKVVIVDIDIPKLSGLHLTKQIKRKYPDLPVVMMTAYSNIFTEKDAIQNGANDYLKKPFEIKTMIKKVKNLTYQYQWNNI